MSCMYVMDAVLSTDDMGPIDYMYMKIYILLSMQRRTGLEGMCINIKNQGYQGY